MNSTTSFVSKYVHLRNTKTPRNSDEYGSRFSEKNMSNDLIHKKIDQLRQLLKELSELVKLPFSEFKKEFIPLYESYISSITTHISKQDK